MDPVECQNYTDYIPDYAERELARLHPGRYSSLPHFEVYGLADQASTYVARRDDQATALLLYRREGPVVRVLNEGMPLALEEAQRFADYMFARAASPAAVVLRAVEMAPGPAGKLVQKVACEQDSVLPLPAGRDAYLRSLGASTRSLLKNRLNKLKREHPGFEFRLAEAGRIDPQQVRAVLAMHRARFSGRRHAVRLDAEEEERVMRMLSRCGMVGVITIDGRCCAGSICYQTGDVISGRFLGHDPAYDSYRLGFLCAYLMCAACADRGDLKKFNFGWGNEEYKAHLGGHARTLYDVAIYRSQVQRWRLARLGLQLALRGWRYRLRIAYRALKALRA